MLATISVASYLPGRIEGQAGRLATRYESRDVQVSHRAIHGAEDAPDRGLVIGPVECAGDQPSEFPQQGARRVDLALEPHELSRGGQVAVPKVLKHRGVRR